MSAGAWLAIAVLVAAVVWILSADPRAVPLAGDESSFIYNAISLRRGDLSYDALDQADWAALGWEEQPLGLFLRATEHGWAIAKPVGYSVVLAPALYLFGLHGVHVAGALMLLAYVACWYFAGRLAWSREVSIMVAVAAGVASHAWFYSFTAHADLFVAVLVGIVVYGCLRTVLMRDGRWLWLAAAGAGLLVTEKVPALLALTPVLLVAALRVRGRDVLIAGALLVSVGLLSAAPYLYYSGGTSWSPYGGERYVATRITPWSGGTVDDLTRLRTEEMLSPSFVFERLRSPSDNLPEATLTYVIGRHTGVLTFLPIVPALVAAGVVTLARARRGSTTIGGVDLDGSGPVVEHGGDSDRDLGGSDVASAGMDPVDQRGDSRAALALRTDRLMAWAGAASLLLYVAFYLVLFTYNYYGGGQSIGSRYFLQFSVVAIVVPVAAGLGRRGALLCAGFAVLWAVVVLGPHLMHADSAFIDLWRTSRVQRLLPLDDSQVGQFPGACERPSVC